ncbi:MAG: hypothetical protein AAFR79_03955 [Pseudomonadota bacterium]
MDTFRWIAQRAALCLPLVLAAPQADGQPTERAFCIEPPHDRICPSFPQDQTDFSRFFEYRIVNDTAQAPFDEYAWQAFVALHWADLGLGPETENWRRFARKIDVLDPEPGPCTGRTDGRHGVVASPKQSDGTQLIDQNGNFVVYETRLNSVAEHYLVENALTTASGRAKFGQPISFPRGSINDQAAPILLKFAWQILQEPKPGMIGASGVVPIPSNQSVDGEARCLPVKLGLVGMHIVTKVESGHGDKWIWATFEHADTVPTAANARAINSIYDRDLFPDGCAAPDEGNDRAYLLYDPSCPDCPRNRPPVEERLWAAEAPFAITASGLPAPRSQIVRCWKVFEPTRETNSAWQAQLRGTPLENYILISSQWRGANPDPLFPNGELPRYLSNATMETYIQTDPIGTCLGCHANARTAEGNPSDFTFLLR